VANTSVTEEYNGTSWSSGGALIVSRRLLVGTGTQNEGLAAGGYTNTNSSSTEEYNGTSWATSNSMIVARYGLAGAGSQGASLVAGGNVGQNCTEEYLKSSYTIVDCIL
jgi:hypothetical protein